MPSAGDEMSAGEPNTINYYAYTHYGLYIISHCTNVTQLFSFYYKYLNISRCSNQISEGYTSSNAGGIKQTFTWIQQKGNLRCVKGQFVFQIKCQHPLLFVPKDDENSTLSSKLKEVEEERTRLQRTTNVQQTHIDKQKALAEESNRKCEGLQQQVASLQKVVEYYYSKIIQFPHTSETHSSDFTTEHDIITQTL